MSFKMKKYILPLILIFVLLFISVGDCADLYGTYDQRIKLTTDNTKVDAALSNFPVTVFFTSTQGEEIFVEFDADSDYMQCAFTLSDGTTQLYAEKELFDDSAQKAIYHVKVPSVASGADTDIYFYYDNDAANNTTYIGAINTTAGGTVWDANFKAVYHMVDATTSTVVDSTSNNVDGTKTSAGNPAESQVTVMVGKYQVFTDDKITTSGAYTDNGFTISMCSKPTNLTNNQYVTFGTSYDRCVLLGYQDNYYNMYNSGYPTGTAADTQITATDNTWQHIVYGSDGTNVLGYKNGSVVINVVANLNTADITSYNIGGEATDWYVGSLDEMRISNTLRSAAWIKATYNSLWDSLLTYGSEETSGAAEDNAVFFGMNF